jgi:hypothetical protein
MSEPEIFLIRPTAAAAMFRSARRATSLVRPNAREHAISYARNCRTAQCHGEIRVLTAAGEWNPREARPREAVRDGREAEG